MAFLIFTITRGFPTFSCLFQNCTGRCDFIRRGGVLLSITSKPGIFCMLINKQVHSIFIVVILKFQSYQCYQTFGHYRDKYLLTHLRIAFLTLWAHTVFYSSFYSPQWPCLFYAEGFHSGDYGCQMGGQLNFPSICMTLLIFPTLFDP